jgi:hypothetical protein
MDRYHIDTYAKAEDRMRTNGFIFDVGQISPTVRTELYLGERLGLITVTSDSWPIRGLAVPVNQQRVVFALRTKDSV